MERPLPPPGGSGLFAFQGNSRADWLNKATAKATASTASGNQSDFMATSGCDGPDHANAAARFRA